MPGGRPVPSVPKVEPRQAENVALGRVLRQLRKDARLTQDALAERAEVPITKLQRIETGDIDADWGTLRRLAYALETSLTEVFRLTEFDHAEEQQQDQGHHRRDQ